MVFQLLRLKPVSFFCFATVPLFETVGFAAAAINNHFFAFAFF